MLIRHFLTEGSSWMNFGIGSRNVASMRSRVSRASALSGNSRSQLSRAFPSASQIAMAGHALSLIGLSTVSGSSDMRSSSLVGRRWPFDCTGEGLRALGGRA